MFEVKERNIREAYDLLKFMTSDPAVAEKKGKTAIYVADLKRAIRAYTNRPAPDARVIKYYSYGDGYVELYRFPAELADATYDEVVEWFNDNKRLCGGGGQYDCTGEKFTEWRHIFKRRDGWYAYHSVGINV